MGLWWIVGIIIMAGMFGADNNNTKAMMQDLEDVASMYSQAKPASDDGIMKAPQGDQIDAGSWWAWLSGATRRKAQENIARVQEELSKMNVDLSGTSPQYQQELLDGILQARQYRKDWDITESLSDKPKWLEQQGDFPMPEQSKVTTEELPPMDEEASLESRLSNIRYVRSDNDETIDVSPSAEAADQQGIMTKPKATPVATAPATSNATEGMGFLTFISKGEGGYESSNRGTKNNKIQGSTHSTTRDNKKLSEMTIDEIRAKMKIKSADNADRLFAVGKYQLIPSTFEMAVKATGLSGDTVFNPETQEKLGQYLLFEKRPALGAYIKGESNDMNKALLEAAKEWASLPVPSGSKKGKSYYGKGNKAQHTLEETISALTKARTAYMEKQGAGPTEDIVRPRLRDDK
jgi:hypothetical protein